MNVDDDNKTLRFLGGVLFVNVFAAGMFILFGGLWPKTPIGWVLLLGLGGPVWLFVEYIGDKLFAEKVSKKIDSSEKTVSISRIIYGVIVMVIFLALFAVTQYYFKGFLTKHFSNWHLTTG